MWFIFNALDMKKYTFIILILLSMQVRATWAPFGPEGIQANRICFTIDQHPHWGICHDGGLYLYDLISQSWTDHPSGLPVWDACYLDGQNILVIMGDGTDSDGIYQFDPVSDTFELLQFIDIPKFICYDETQQTYYVGHHLGLLSSPNGLSWTPIDTFVNRSIVSMGIYENHFVVSEMDNLYGIWSSEDAGVTWTLYPYSPMISCLGFDNQGKLYGIFPDNSYSSGLWSSTDFGENWDVEFWSLEMRCVGFDYANVFVGWGENAYPPQVGIAWFHPETDSLTCINANLPNLVINQITHNPSMSAIALFCCTENGVYVSYDYYLGLPESPGLAVSTLSIHPNPATNQTVLTFQPTVNKSQGTLSVFDMAGTKVWQTKTDFSTGEIVFDCSILVPGVYLIELKCGDSIRTGKLIVN